jgi:signal peptidase I
MTGKRLIEIALGSVFAHVGWTTRGCEVMTQIRLSKTELPKTESPRSESPKSESAWATAALLALSFILMVLVLSLPLLFRSFLFQPFSIPAGSMIPTLLVGDYFFVSKYAYGYSRYTWPFSWPSSWPFSPPSSGRIWGSEPARGDVVAFLLPKDNSTVYIKRVVGLPGDRIQMKQGLLHINGAPVARERLPNIVGEDPCGARGSTRTSRWRETLPNGVSHETLDCVDNGFYDDTNIYTVPTGHFFMLGDNRDNSTDSRVPSAFGYVPLENIIGRAGVIYFSIDRYAAGTGSRFRTERMGLMIR